ncbi:hypothetical protein [Streptomyces sp. NPDC020362]|uniref:hypothetical protein n=1 Tax=unclassified Streptomyces TaxID=2593676 RepID=UPI000A5B2C05
MRVRVLALISVAVAVLLTGCSSTPAEDLKSWYTSGGEDEIKALSDDSSKINDLSMASSSVLAPACRELTTHVAAAEKDDPIPDKGAQSYWSKALASFKRGASDCTAGANKQDDVQASQGVREIQTEGIPDLMSTTSLIRSGLESK